MQATAHIDPKTPPKEKERGFKLKALRLIMKHGFNNLKQWVAEGQYEDSKAIQFGGFELQPGPELLLEWLDKKLQNTKEISAMQPKNWGFHVELCTED